MEPTSRHKISLMSSGFVLLLMAFLEAVAVVMPFLDNAAPVSRWTASSGGVFTVSQRVLSSACSLALSKPFNTVLLTLSQSITPTTYQNAPVFICVRDWNSSVDGSSVMSSLTGTLRNFFRLMPWSVKDRSRKDSLSSSGVCFQLVSLMITTWTRVSTE